MGHWRDGGIGTMVGSDDRPFEEWTLLERLAAAADGKVCGLSADKLAQAAFDEIQRLRGGYPAEIDRPATRLRMAAAELDLLPQGRLVYDKSRRTIVCDGQPLGITIEDTPLA